MAGEEAEIYVAVLVLTAAAIALVSTCACLGVL